MKNKIIVMVLFTSFASTVLADQALHEEVGDFLDGPGMSKLSDLYFSGLAAGLSLACSNEYKKNMPPSQNLNEMRDELKEMIREQRAKGRFMRPPKGWNALDAINYTSYFIACGIQPR